MTRRVAMASGAAGGLVAAGIGRAGAEAPPKAVRLKKEITERALPARMLGLNTPCVYDIPYEDPAAVQALAKLAPNIVRFPGGTVGNYYNWRIGYMEVPDVPQASAYRKLLINSSVPASKRLHPKGIFIEDWMKVAEFMAADLVFNPNLETSSLEEQGAWFADMHKKGIVPKYIEMGTEFYLAMFMEPAVIAIFPDWKTTLKRTKDYYDVMKPYLPADAKIAVQSASSRLHHLDPMKSTSALARREAQWDRDMAPESWFHAVTTHIYPGCENSAGPGALKGLPDNVDQVYPAMIARADEGYDRTLSDTAAKMPGKEIWMTEWGAFEAQQTLAGVPHYFSGMWLHQVTRGLMAMLRHPQLTVANYHAAFFSGNLMSSFRRTPDGYEQINASSALHWFFAASRGPNSHYQRLAVEGGERIAAQGTIPGERFWDVEACILRQGNKRTLFVHNAWKVPVRVDISDLVGEAVPLGAETIATPDLLVNLEKGTPIPEPLATRPHLDVPAYSLSRIVWST